MNTVQATARDTLGSVVNFDAFDSRLSALVRLQGLLVETAAEDVDFAELIRLEISTLGVQYTDRVTMDGPALQLNVENARELILAIHELAANAVRDGSLGTQAGRLEIRWSIEQTEKTSSKLSLVWHEKGFNLKSEASLRGYGRKLVEQALPYSLRAKTELTFEPMAVRCHIEVPLDLPSTIRRIDVQ